MGWTKEQAAGIVGNLQEESGKNLDTKAVGDGRKAKGIAQWHPDRQAKFQEIMGKQVMDATLEEQLKFVDWELKNSHKVAGDKLKNAISFTVDEPTGKLYFISSDDNIFDASLSQ